MVRQRLKHKDVRDTIEQNDFEVLGDRIKGYWQQHIRPYETQIWIGIIALVVVVGGYFWISNRQAAKVSNANYYLSAAREYFESGNSTAALEDLSYVLPGGSHSLPALAVPAEILQSNIAYASGEYDNAAAILGNTLANAPELLRVDIQYQLAATLEARADFEGALRVLDEIEGSLGETPDLDDVERKPSSWDRYFFVRGRVLYKSGDQEAGMAELLKVSPRSAWGAVTEREIAWLKAQPVGPVPAGWQAG